MRFLFFLLLLLSATSLVAQEVPAKGPEPFSREWYERRAKRQKTIAYALVGGGVSMSITGAILLRTDAKIIYQLETEAQRSKREARERTGVRLAIGGLVVVAGSVPLFIASGRNRRMARLQVVNETSWLPDPASRGSFAALRLGFSL